MKIKHAIRSAVAGPLHLQDNTSQPGRTRMPPTVSSGPAPLPGGGGGPGDRGAELLAQVKLLAFTVTPDQILPFQPVTLRWDVQSPPGVNFSLDFFASRVSAAGIRILHPGATTSFTLQARALQAETTLGTVTVSVDSSKCTLDAENNLALPMGALLEGVFLEVMNQLMNQLQLTGTVSAAHPSVTFAPGIISYEQKASAAGVDFDVNGSFGLTVDQAQDQLAPIGASTTATASFSANLAINLVAGLASGALLAWLGPLLFLAGVAFPVAVLIGLGAFILGGILGALGANALQTAINNAVGLLIANAMNSSYAAVVKTISTERFHEPANTAMAAVSIDTDPANAPDGIITVTFCPKPGAGGGTGVIV
jgi:hypothetical protein